MKIVNTGRRGGLSVGSLIDDIWLRRLEAWHDFYVFAGTAAATLMGLMFVVVSVGQRTLNRPEGLPAIRAFFTPIVAFFATGIVLAMLMLMPYTSAHALGVLLAILGIAGLAYMFATGAHAAWRRSDLALDDWIWYVALPFVSYLAICAGGIALRTEAAAGFYVIGAAAILLLAIGIRNAWDLVVYISQRSEE